MRGWPPARNGRRADRCGGRSAELSLFFGLTVCGWGMIGEMVMGSVFLRLWCAFSSELYQDEPSFILWSSLWPFSTASVSVSCGSCCGPMSNHHLKETRHTRGAGELDVCFSLLVFTKVRQIIIELPLKSFCRIFFKTTSAKLALQEKLKLTLPN